MKRYVTIIFVLVLALAPFQLLSQTPGGVATSIETWFDANSGTVGTPITQWNNLAGNTSITSVTSPTGANMSANDLKANYNNVVNTQGGYNGTFHAVVPNRTNLISGSGITMYAAYQRGGAPDLMFNFHSSIGAGGGDSFGQWRTWGFRHGGLGSLFSNGTTHLYDNTAMAAMSENSGFVGMYGRENGAGGNTLNGNNMSYGNIGSFYSGTSDMELSIGYWPGYGMARGVMEAVVWSRDLSATERNRVESYFGIKYGITLGMNGTSKNYVSPSTGAVIWTQASNIGYNNDIAGISRADVSGLDQRKSHSTFGNSVGSYNDIVTVANGTNFSSPAAMSADDSHLLWGHNGAGLINTGVIVNYPTDNAEIIETIFQRVWKSEENGTVGTVTIEFNLSNVPGVLGTSGANDLSFVRLLIDEDGDFTNGATSIAPSSYNNASDVVYFQHDFVAGNGNPLTPSRGFFFTIGSTDETFAPLPVELMGMEVKNEQCSNLITWSTASEKNSSHFVVERSYNMLDWHHVTTVQAAGYSESQLDYMTRDAEFTQNGVMYYRLIQFDINGEKNILQLKSIQADCEDNKVPVVYPNPAKDQLFVESFAAGNVKVTDINGRILFEGTIINGITPLNITDLAKGTYMVSLELINGKQHVVPVVKW